MGDLGTAGHDVGGRAGLDAVYVTADIAIGDDAGQRAGAVHDADTAQPAGRHGQQHVAHGRVRRGQRYLTAGMHQVGDAHQSAAQAAAGMEVAILVVRKAPSFH